MTPLGASYNTIVSFKSDRQLCCMVRSDTVGVLVIERYKKTTRRCACQDLMSVYHLVSTHQSPINLFISSFAQPTECQ